MGTVRQLYLFMPITYQKWSRCIKMTEQAQITKLMIEEEIRTQYLKQRKNKYQNKKKLKTLRVIGVIQC